MYLRIEIHKADNGYQIQVFEYPKDVRGERINADLPRDVGNLVEDLLLRDKKEKEKDA